MVFKYLKHNLCGNDSSAWAWKYPCVFVCVPIPCLSSVFHTNNHYGVNSYTQEKLKYNFILSINKWWFAKCILQDKAFAVVLRVLTAVKSAEVEKAVKTLDKNEQDVLMKYIYRGFAEPTEGSSATLLTWHEKVSIVLLSHFSSCHDVVTTLFWETCVEPEVTHQYSFRRVYHAAA